MSTFDQAMQATPAVAKALGITERQWIVLGAVSKNGKHWLQLACKLTGEHGRVDCATFEEATEYLRKARVPGAEVWPDNSRVVVEVA